MTAKGAGSPTKAETLSVLTACGSKGPVAGTNGEPKMIKIDAAVLLQMLNRVKKFAGTDNEFILNTVHTQHPQTPDAGPHARHHRPIRALLGRRKNENPINQTRVLA